MLLGTDREERVIYDDVILASVFSSTSVLQYM